MLYEIWALLLGLTLTIGAKMWFLDRMVWRLFLTRHAVVFDRMVCATMAKTHASYAAWIRPHK